MKYTKFGISEKALTNAIISLGFAHISNNAIHNKTKGDNNQEVRIKVDHNNTCSILFDTYVVDPTSTELVKSQAKLLIKANGNTVYSVDRKVKYRGYPDSEPIKLLYATLVWGYNQRMYG